MACCLGETRQAIDDTYAGFVRCRKRTAAGARYIWTDGDGRHFGQAAGRAATRSRAAAAQQLCTTNPHEPPRTSLPVCCNALLREVSWWAPWRGSLDGMQEIRWITSARGWLA